MVEPYKDMLTKVVHRLKPGELDIELESALQRLRTFGITRINGEISSSLHAQRRGRQIFTAGGNCPQHAALQGQEWLVHRTHLNAIGGETHPFNRLLRHHNTRQWRRPSDDVTEEFSPAVVPPWHVNHLWGKEYPIASGTRHKLGCAFAGKGEISLFGGKLLTNDLRLGAVRNKLGGIFGLQLRHLGLAPAQLSDEGRLATLDQRVSLYDLRSWCNEKLPQEPVGSGAHHGIFG